MRPGQFAVFPVDLKFHRLHDESGTLAGADPLVAVYPSLGEAEAHANEIVARFPALFCEIYDHEGKVKEPVRVIYNASVKGKYVGRPAAWRFTYWGAFILACGVALVTVDGLHDWHLIWGYVIGNKLILAGGALLLRGLLGFRSPDSAV